MRRFNKKEFKQWAQFTLLMFMTTMGFLFTYVCLWIIAGFPSKDWSFWVVAGMAIASELLFLRWVIE